jgi:hypothetical protein
MKNLLLLLPLIFNLSCGYQFGQGCLLTKYQTMSIPYVIGDTTGELTAILIKQISRSSAFRYVREGGDLVLNVSLCECSEENIGFCYDTKKDKNDREDKERDSRECRKREFNHSIIPIESRATIIAEVTVIDCSSGCNVLGPAKLFASVDFDHDYYYSPDRINVFSLGQLTDVDAARDAVQTPLYTALAEKISEYILHSW